MYSSNPKNAPLSGVKKVTWINKKLRTWLGIIYLLATLQIFSF